MIGYTAALVRWEHGHLYIDRTPPGERRREVYLEMGSVSDREVAEDVANELLTIHAGLRTTFGLACQVRRDEQVPGVVWGLGDRMTDDGDPIGLVQSYTVTLVGDGLVEVTPELGDPVAVRLAGIARRLQRISSGASSEYARPNITDTTTAHGTDTTPPEFSLSGTVTESLAPAWRATRPWWCSWLDVQMRLPDVTAPTVVQLLRETASGAWGIQATAVVPAGAKRGLVVVNRGWTRGQRLTMAVTSTGGFGEDLTASLRGVMT